MKARIIGSTAAYHWFPHKMRAPVDLDILTPAKISTSSLEDLVIDASWHEMAQRLIDENIDPVFLDPEKLLALKISHSFWDVKWNKTMFDIHQFMLAGVQYDVDEMADLHRGLYAVWERVHGPKHVNMMQSAETFFNPHVRREFEHDELHEVLKFSDSPAFRRYQTDPDLVNLDLSKATHEELMTLAMEEMMVIATERFNLRADSHMHDILSALLKAHKILVTSATKGSFAMFLVLNAYDLRCKFLKHMAEHLILKLPRLGLLKSNRMKTT